jgi:PAS domain S-box-containing protein
LSLRAHLLLLIALVIVPPIAVQMAGAGASAFGLGALTLSLLPGAVAIWCFGIYGIARPRQLLLAAVTLWTQDDWAARVELDRGMPEFRRLGTLLNAIADKVDEEQRQLQHSIEESEQSRRETAGARARLIGAIEAIPEGFAMWDAEDRFVLCNRRYRELYGDSGELLRPGEKFADILRERAVRGEFGEDGADAWVQQRLDHRSALSDAAEHQLVTGEWLRVMDRRMGDGGVASVSVDITDLKRREATFRLLFESNPLPMMVYDFKTLRFLEVNHAAIEHYGYSREQFLAMTIEEIRPPDERERSRRIGGRSPALLRKLGTWRHRKADGSTIIVDVTSHQLNFHGRNAALVAAVDVTEQQRAEMALQESELRLRKNEAHLARAREIAEIGSFERDFSAEESVWSDNQYKIFGVDQASFVPNIENIRALIHPDDRASLAAFEHEMLAGGKARTLEYRIVRPNGEIRRVLRESEAIRDDDGIIIGMRGAVRDVTAAKTLEAQRRDLEMQLQHARRVEALGTLAGGIAHDLNNTMVPVLALSQLLIDKFPPGSTDRSCMETIHQAGMHSRDLIKQILAFSRKEKSAKRIVDLAGFLRDAALMIRAMAPSTIEIDYALMDGPAPILGDPSQLHQILINLVTNAAQAIGDGIGKIVIGVAPGVQNSGVQTPAAPGSAAPTLRLSLRDTGAGMDAATMERIFEPFFTTKAVGEGTGLGLAVVYGIVADHGGTVEVTSEPGRGTQFDIVFPALALTAEGTASGEPADDVGCELLRA